MKRADTVISVIFAALILFGLWECGMGWAQLAGFTPSRHSLYPATGTFYNPGPFCAFLAAIMPAAVYGAMKRGNVIIHWGCIAYIIMAAGIMPVLMGRTGWIAAIAGSAVVYCGVKKVKRPSWPIILLALTVVAAAVVALFYLKPASALGRLFLWQTGLSACLESPVTGVGWENVAGALGRAQEQYFASHPGSPYAQVAGSPEYAFNEFIQIGIAFGLPAMLLFAGSMITAAIIGWKKGQYDITGVVVAFAIACFSSYPLQFKEFVVLAAAVLIAALIAVARGRAVLASVLCAVIAIVTATAVNSIHSREKAAADWKTLRLAYAYNLTDRDITVLDSLSTRHGHTAAFLFDYGKALRENGRLDKSTAVLEQGLEHSSDPMFLNLIGRNHEDAGRYDQAEHYYRRAIDRLPGRLYPHYLLCRLYLNPGCSDTARFVTAAREMLAIDPKIESPATRQMRQEIARLNDSIRTTTRPHPATP